MSTEQHIYDEEVNLYSGDAFNLDSIILIQLNRLPTQFKKNTLIDALDCNVVEKYVIKNKQDVFKSIYNTGKELFNSYIKSKYESLFAYQYHGQTDVEIQNFHKEVFNRYVIENGYPYLIETLPHMIDKVYSPEYFEFANECLTIYLIEELRKWILKLKNKTNKSYSIKKDGAIDTFPTYQVRRLYEILKSRLLSMTKSHDTILIYDDITKEEAINVLEKGLPIDDSNKKLTALDFEYRDKFIRILQRTLIYYILSIINGPYKNQYTITKQLPIYNTETEQYRLYTTAHSLMGIAYDTLLFSLTALKESYKRSVCEFPNCNNEFEKIGNSPYCSIHTPSEIRAYTQHKYYEKHKKEATDK